jgi:hypothetical protein
MLAVIELWSVAHALSNMACATKFLEHFTIDGLLSF